MKHRDFHARRLDVASFAREGATLQGSLPLPELQRLIEVLHADANLGAATLNWSARGELRRRHAVSPQTWLHLHAVAVLPFVCQRCLGPVDTSMTVDRWIRFVATEEQAAALDAEGEDDVLSLDPPPDLLELIEDELLLDAPIVPRHDRCPNPLQATADDAEHEVATQDSAPARSRQPFASLASLREQLKSSGEDSDNK